HAARQLTIDVRVSPQHTVRAERQDLDEMLGNLLDNACKWAASCVAIETSRERSQIVIVVTDDGPGLDESKRDLVMSRGVRAHAREPGSGLGLSIVADLANLYDGSISLGDTAARGLRAELRLPAPSDIK